MFYHASRTKLPIGTQLGPYSQNHYTTNSSANPVHALINPFMDGRMPAGAVPRTSGVYIFDDLDNAVAFAHAEWKASTAYYYEATPAGLVSGPHPMALVDLLVANHGQSQVWQDATDEYWDPAHEWEFNEFLTVSATVGAEATPSAIPGLAGALGRVRLINDQSLRKRLWP